MNSLEVFRLMRSGHKRSLLNSLHQLVNSDDPYSLRSVKLLQSGKFERLRKFRVGPYRVFFEGVPGDLSHQKHPYMGIIIIVDIRQRKDAY